MHAAGPTRGLMNVCLSEVRSPSASLFSSFLLKTFWSPLADRGRNDVGSMLLSEVSQTLTLAPRTVLNLTPE